LKKADILFFTSILIKGSAKIPPFPPFAKGGGGGFEKVISKG
jgi:hypothetical protein